MEGVGKDIPGFRHARDQAWAWSWEWDSQSINLGQRRGSWRESEGAETEGEALRAKPGSWCLALRARQEKCC